MKILNEYIEPEGFADFKQMFLEAGIPRKYKKNDFCFRQGELSSFLGYIQLGSVRYLTYNSKEEEQIVGYSFENDFVIDYGTFQMQVNAVISAQAIHDSIILTISHNKVNSFFENCSNKQFRSILAESFMRDIYSRFISLYSDTPEKRYLSLIHRHPKILNLVSLKEIASLLKITPETLSRIRKKISLS